MGWESRGDGVDGRVFTLRVPVGAGHVPALVAAPNALHLYEMNTIGQLE